MSDCIQKPYIGEVINSIPYTQAEICKLFEEKCRVNKCYTDDV